jgi:hypothetical protein
LQLGTALRLCELRKDCRTGIDHGTKVLKTHLHFFIFQLPKAGTRTIAQLPIAEGLNFRSLNSCIYDCKLWNEKKDLIQVRICGHLNLLPHWQLENKEVL